MQTVVVQTGAREHYAVAQALHQRGLLAGLVTDWYAYGQSGRQGTEIRDRGPDDRGRKTEGSAQRTEVREQRTEGGGSGVMCRWLGTAVLCYLGSRGRAALAAHCEALPDELVYAFPLRTLLSKWRVRQMARQGRLYEAYVRTDSAFARAVARLKLPPHDVFFGYSYASLEILAAEKKRGVLTVLDQIDPGAAEFRLVAEEMARFPELAGPPPDFPTAHFARNRSEWELADIIVVNSEWSRDALVAEGADPAKIEILPLAYEAEEKEVNIGFAGRADRPRSGDLAPAARGANDRAYSSRPQGESGRGGAATPYPTSDFCPLTSDLRPLRVLWLGQVNVRKGIHYLMEAAKLLQGENIQFDVVGPVGILPGAVASAPKNMTFHGPVSRDRAAEWYRQSDVFVLPTLSDGFALTQLEAMAHGLPVVATPNCGRVVEDGKTGFMVPPRDAAELVTAILKFSTDRHLSAFMAPACREAVKAFSVATYGDRLIAIIDKYSRQPLSSDL